METTRKEGANSKASALFQTLAERHTHFSLDAADELCTVAEPHSPTELGGRKWAERVAEYTEALRIGDVVDVDTLRSGKVRKVEVDTDTTKEMIERIEEDWTEESRFVDAVVRYVEVPTEVDLSMGDKGCEVEEKSESDEKSEGRESNEGEKSEDVCIEVEDGERKWSIRLPTQKEEQKESRKVDEGERCESVDIGEEKEERWLETTGVHEEAEREVREGLEKWKWTKEGRPLREYPLDRAVRDAAGRKWMVSSNSAPMDGVARGERRVAAIVTAAIRAEAEVDVRVVVANSFNTKMGVEENEGREEDGDVQCETGDEKTAGRSRRQQTRRWRIPARARGPGVDTRYEEVRRLEKRTEEKVKGEKRRRGRPGERVVKDMECGEREVHVSEVIRPVAEVSATLIQRKRSVWKRVASFRREAQAQEMEGDWRSETVTVEGEERTAEVGRFKVRLPIVCIEKQAVQQGEVWWCISCSVTVKREGGKGETKETSSREMEWRRELMREGEVYYARPSIWWCVEGVKVEGETWTAVDKVWYNM